VYCVPCPVSSIYMYVRVLSARRGRFRIGNAIVRLGIAMSEAVVHTTVSTTHALERANTAHGAPKPRSKRRVPPRDIHVRASTIVGLNAHMMLATNTVFTKPIATHATQNGQPIQLQAASTVLGVSNTLHRFAFCVVRFAFCVLRFRVFESKEVFYFYLKMERLKIANCKLEIAKTENDQKRAKT